MNGNLAAARLCAAMLAVAAPDAVFAQEWPYYGGDAGGSRYSGADEITPANVDGLRRQWVFHTGDLVRRAADALRRSKFEATPILADGRLVFCTPFNEVIALDPGNGRAVWRHDPQVGLDRHPANKYVCRGVAFWADAAAAPGALCAHRIFTGTTDARLIALDAASGAPCPGFGEAGEVRIDPGMELIWPGEYQISSAPMLAGDVVIVGSSIGDNARAEAPRGTVRAFDARSGRLRWAWDPLPADAKNVGHANVWAPMSSDPARDLVVLPTTSASPDFFGGLRPGDNRHANSVVALHAQTGELAWAFQIVHHDLWDYDTPAQPTLATLTLDGQPRDVVIQGTKQGLLFVLDRDNGEPVFPVEERPVPQGGAPGEALSPTQPFPADMPALAPSRIGPADAFGFTPWDRGACRRAIAAARAEGLYTPPSTQGTILYPFTGGGVNWGGVAVDPSGRAYANTMSLMHRVTLIPAADVEAWDKRWPDKEVSRQSGAPFGMMREVLLSPLGVPCNPPPWGSLTAVDLATRRILWRVNLGTTEALAPLGVAMDTGAPNVGGPLITAGGLVFIAATMDPYLRAFDAGDGALLWTARLPAPGTATPMTYVWEGRQYVVIGAGGHSDLGDRRGDALVAFALPRPGEPARSWRERYLERPGTSFALGTTGLAALVLMLALAAYLFRRRRKRMRD